MTHVTCRLTAKDRDQLRNPTLGNRVWATFTFLLYQKSVEYLSIKKKTFAFNKTVTVYIFYHTSKILQTRKKSVFFNVVRKTFTDVKFTVDDSAFQTVITLCTKNLSNASCASRLKQFILMAPTGSGSTQCKEITEIDIY